MSKNEIKPSNEEDSPSDSMLENTKAKEAWYKRYPKRTFKIVFGILILLVAFRIALPHIVLHYVNKTLQEDLPGYYGRVIDVDICLYRGAYEIIDMDIQQTDGENMVPFFRTDLIDLSVQWEAIWDGALVGEVIMFNPEVNFVGDPGAMGQSGEGVDWREPIRDLFPLKINRFEVVNGSAHYREFQSEPKINLYVNKVTGVATNLTNSKNLSKTLVSEIKAEGIAMAHAPVSLSMDLDPLDEKGTFNMDLTMKDLPLTTMNDFMKAYADIDSEGGTVEMYMECVGQSGKVKGYLKPFAHEPHIFSLKNDDENIFQILKEGIAGLFAEILENPKTDNVATEIPFEGDLNEPDVKFWPVLGKLITNAFFKALMPSLKNTLSLQSVEGIETDAGKTEKELKEERKEKKKAEKEARKAEKKRQKEIEKAQKEREKELEKAQEEREERLEEMREKDN